MIEIKNLTKKFGETIALDDVSFEVKKGEVLGFLGPNGAGKTTTMRIIAGFLYPTSGTVRVAGIDVLENPLGVRKRIGYLAENNPLYQDLQVIEYLNFTAEIRKIEKTTRRERLKQIVETCGIKDVLTKTIGELSKGYRQRIGLSQVLIHDPEILILDEPTAGLDPNQIVEIRSLIKEIGKEKTILLSSHILTEVSLSCENVVIINRGKIVARGLIDELKRQAKGKRNLYTKIRGPQALIIKELTSLVGVRQVNILDQEKGAVTGFGLDTSDEYDLREKIFNLAVKNAWVLLELREETADLEDIFRELTINENA